MTILQFNNISYKYPSGTVALNGVTFTIERGEKVVLMGSNGSGKSSLFLTLAGVIKPDEGEYLINNKAFRYCKKHRKHLCQTIGYVFQDPDVQVVSTHVNEDIAFGLRNIGMKEPEVQERIEQYLASTGIAELKEKTIHTLSYGQKKQVAVAGVLAMEPDVIMLDEPFAWLDYSQSKRLKLLLDELSLQGKTIIVSTHDSDFAYQWGQHALVMQNGELKADLSVSELMENERLMSDFDLAPISMRMISI